MAFFWNAAKKGVYLKQAAATPVQMHKRTSLITVVTALQVALTVLSIVLSALDPRTAPDDDLLVSTPLLGAPRLSTYATVKPSDVVTILGRSQSANAKCSSELNALLKTAQDCNTYHYVGCTHPLLSVTSVEELFFGIMVYQKDVPALYYACVPPVARYYYALKKGTRPFISEVQKTEPYLQYDYSTLAQFFAASLIDICESTATTVLELRNSYAKSVAVTDLVEIMHNTYPNAAFWNYAQQNPILAQWNGALYNEIMAILMNNAGQISSKATTICRLMEPMNVAFDPLNVNPTLPTKFKWPDLKGLGLVTLQGYQAQIPQGTGYNNPPFMALSSFTYASHDALAVRSFDIDASNVVQIALQNAGCKNHITTWYKTTPYSSYNGPVVVAPLNTFNKVQDLHSLAAMKPGGTTLAFLCPHSEQINATINAINSFYKSLDDYSVTFAIITHLDDPSMVTWQRALSQCPRCYLGVYDLPENLQPWQRTDANYLLLRLVRTFDSMYPIRQTTSLLPTFSNLASGAAAMSVLSGVFNETTIL